MKTLLEIVKEEIGFTFGKQSDLVNGSSISAEDFERAKNFDVRLKNRIEQDKALSFILTEVSPIINRVSKLPLIDSFKEFLYAKIFASFVMVWEDANNKFNEQFKVKEK